MSDPSRRVERKLAAVLAADIAGYSALMTAHEEATVRDLKAHQSVVLPMIADFGGRVIDTAGDGILAEFASVLNAVDCAVAIQRIMAERNASVSPERRMQYRIGLNQGDVIYDEARLYGDGINIAARLESIAEAGGICLSGKVYEEIDGKIDLPCEDIGPQQLKNIARPVRAFRVSAGALNGPTSSTMTPAETAALPAPDGPSIAVLPFTNMSGDPEQEFFADGLTEDILTALSRFREYFVISRNSTFVYKGRAVNIQEVAKALGAQYVLEGSVRKAGNRVRITVQLIDARKDRHVWADRYDRELEDIFAIQDEVTASIVATLSGQVEAATYQSIARKATDSMAAYERVLTAKVLHHRWTKEDNLAAQKMIEGALALDPNYAHAHAWRACIVGQSIVNNWSPDQDVAWRIVNDELKTALALDRDDSDVHRILSAVNLLSHNYEACEHHQQRAVALNPNNDLIVVERGEFHTWQGEAEKGIEWIKKAMRLNPHHPDRYWNHLGRAYFVARRYRDAVDAFRHISHPNQFHHAFLAASFAMLDDAAAAATHAQGVLDCDPGFSADAYLQTLHYQRDEDRAHHRGALLKAKLPA